MKILIAGDSFAADWTKKYPNEIGWVNLLANEFDVTNIAQAGVSEYKIWKQIKNEDVEKYDVIIISHTSPWRLHTRKHPIHSDDLLHNNADLMLNDLSYHKSKIKNVFNRSLKCAYEWFLYHYDPDFQEDIYKFFVADILKMVSNVKVIEITNFESIDCKFNYSKYLKTNSGIANHFDYKINKLIFDDIKKVINNGNKRTNNF